MAAKNNIPSIIYILKNCPHLSRELAYIKGQCCHLAVKEASLKLILELELI
jgi:hypothetical protein